MRWDALRCAEMRSETNSLARCFFMFGRIFHPMELNPGSPGFCLSIPGEAHVAGGFFLPHWWRALLTCGVRVLPWLPQEVPKFFLGGDKCRINPKIGMWNPLQHLIGVKGFYVANLLVIWEINDWPSGPNVHDFLLFPSESRWPAR